MCEDLAEGSESASLNRVAQLMAADGLPGWPRRRHRWTRGSPAVTVSGVADVLEQDLLAPEAETSWVTDSAEINTQQGQVYQCITLDLYDQRVVGWSTQARQDRQVVIRLRRWRCGSGKETAW